MMFTEGLDTNALRWVKEVGYQHLHIAFLNHIIWGFIESLRFRQVNC